MVHWTDLPIALAPGPDAIDKDSIYSGCMVINQGVPTIVYTGISGTRESPCIATSQDGMVSWQKYPGNPVIAAPPPGFEVSGFRDHCIWQEGADWYQLIGAGIKGVGGAPLLYRSQDLYNWEYLHPLCVGVAEETGQMWQCPDFFPLGDKYVLTIAPQPDRVVLYYTGTYDREKHLFTPEHKGVFDYGGSYYAPQSFLDEQGRRIIWGWLQEGRSVAAHTEAGWAGVMSCPRILFLHPDGSLGVRPVPELESLRGEHRHRERLSLTGADMAQAPLFDQPVKGSCELIVELDPGDSARCGLRLGYSFNEETGIIYHADTGTLEIDRTASSRSQEDLHDVQGGTCALSPEGTLKLHLLLDGSVLEIFVNERVSFTSRIYPSQTNRVNLDFRVQGGTARLLDLKLWELDSIWTDPTRELPEGSEKKLTYS
jgi:beta-fructofuranosidase